MPRWWTAARELFLERGYGATTVEAISERADVPPATVYRLFSSKHGILKALFDVSIVGDHEDVPMVERPQVRALLDADDPRAAAGRLRGHRRQVNARVGPLYRILVSAAGTDPDAAAQLDELTRQRQQGQRSIARALSRAGALRPELRERDAADLIHALLSPELYRLLVLDRGWSPDRYAMADGHADGPAPSAELAPTPSNFRQSAPDSVADHRRTFGRRSDSSTKWLTTTGTPAYVVLNQSVEQGGRPWPTTSCPESSPPSPTRRGATWWPASPSATPPSGSWPTPTTSPSRRCPSTSRCWPTPAW